MEVRHLRHPFPATTVEFLAQTLCGCPSHPYVASTKILAESEAPRRSCDFPPFRACLLLACCLPNLPNTKEGYKTNTRFTKSVTLTLNCDGGALVTTQRTHFYLILSLILRGGRFALVRPNMRRNMVPWSIRRVALGSPKYFLDNCPQKRTAHVLRVPLSVNSGCLTPTISGAQMWAEWLHHRCLLGGPHMGTKLELAT